jgi:lysophospholipase L1-like esterase
VPLQRQLFWSADIPLAVTAVNTYLQSLQSDRVVIFDAASVLADASGSLRADYSQDELHLNEAGYNALNQGLSGRLLKLSP